MAQTSIKLRFRPSTSKCREGSLYIQIIRERTVKQVYIDCHILSSEWDESTDDIIKTASISDKRSQQLEQIRCKTQWEIRKLRGIINDCERQGSKFSLNDIVERFQQIQNSQQSVFDYMKVQIARLKKLGKIRTSETYQSTLNSFMKFRKDVDLFFDMMDSDLLELYEAYLSNRNISRNSSSFYMRILRAIYNSAAEDGIVEQKNPFRKVYTGVDKTQKRAIGLKEIKKLKMLDLTGNKALEFARDMFLFSFYMRGMSFVDMAYLKKRDLKDGYIIYNRKKTRQQLSIKWEGKMQSIIELHDNHNTNYLLPIITKEDGTERRQYLNKELYVNRKLKDLGKLIGLKSKLTMYVARHSWASIAHNKNIPLAVISQGMGHDSELTTQIYLSNIQTAQIDKANSKILDEL